jgi:hypothetical protein
MNKGTSEGTEEEINFVKLMNKKERIDFWKVLGLNSDEDYAIHVTEHKEGKINDTKIKPKADVFFSEGKVPADELKKKDYYLNEQDSSDFKLRKVDFSGVSVKRKDSDKYQILKMNPSTFKKIFGNFELGAGASIYCTNAEELSKNNSVLKGWNTNWTIFEKFFSDIRDINLLKDNGQKSDIRLRIAREVKEYSNRKIHEMIVKNEKITKFVFQGIGNFEEPFTANWFYESGKLRKAGIIPFNVTTGSGRSKGDFTIVIKPRSV